MDILSFQSKLKNQNLPEGNMSNYAKKKQDKANLISEANNLLKNSGLSQTAKNKLELKIKSGHGAKIKSVIDELKLTEHIDKTKKGISLKDIKAAKKSNQHLKDITAFNKNVLIKTLNNLTEYKNKNIKQLNLKVKGNKFVQVLIKQKMDKKEISALCNKLSKQFHDAGINGSFTVAMKTEYSWRNSKMANFGEHIHLYDATEYDERDQDTYDEIALYFVEATLKPSTAGGATADKNNNCLYNCLLSVLYNRIPWATPEEFKLYLKINVQAKVDISKIPIVEKGLKNFQLNIHGDYTYISTVKSMKVINIKLHNGHYTVIQNENNDKVNTLNVSYNKRKPMIYDACTFMGFDGKNEVFISKKYKSEIKRWQTEYILVNKSDYKKSLKENYDIFIKDAFELNTLTKGAIDLFKTGQDKITALNLFDKYSKYIPTADKINQLEAECISDATTGSIIFARPYVGPGHYYDIKSMYPSIMKSAQVFPVKGGEFKIIDEVEFFKNINYFTYGIYRCEVLKSRDESINRMFRFNYNNKYTHIDLCTAVSLGLTIHLIQDDKANFLFYARDKCLAGSELFSEFVDILFKLKESGIKRCKFILNILWGALCEKKKNKLHVKKTDKLKDHDVEVIGLRPYNDNETIVETVDVLDQYISGFARLKPFLIARGRALIAKIMLPYKNSVMRCHTDGFICSEIPIGIKTGKELGDLVDEGMKTKIQISSCKKAIILMD